MNEILEESPKVLLKSAEASGRRNVSFSSRPPKSVWDDLPLKAQEEYRIICHNLEDANRSIGNGYMVMMGMFVVWLITIGYFAYQRDYVNNWTLKEDQPLIEHGSNLIIWSTDSSGLTGWHYADNKGNPTDQQVQITQ